MNTKEQKKPTAKTAVKKPATAKKVETPKVATAPKTDATQNKSANDLKTAQANLDAILRPNGKTVVKRIQHVQILADKYETMSNKYDELTQFMAGKDNDNSTMKFASAGGYTFGISNPAVISKVLDVIENEFSKALQSAESELVNFKI